MPVALNTHLSPRLHHTPIAAGRKGDKQTLLGWMR